MDIGKRGLAFALGASLVAAACGSNSNEMMNDTGSTSSTGSTAGSVSGTVVKGPVSGATVTAFAITNGSMGVQIGGGTTDAMGNFNVSIGSYGGPVVLQASGGSYADEATGTPMTMMPGDVMSACMPSVAAGAPMTGIQVTPLTTMACARARNMTGAMTAANVTTANTAVGTYFSAGDILSTMPMNPGVSGSGATASQESRNYGMSLAAMSQYAQSIGMTSSSGMVTAMMDDASDGVMDGMMGSSPVSMAGMGGMMSGSMQPTAGRAGMANAMATFIGSAMNKSGVSTADLQALMNQLSGANGQLPGASGSTSATGMMSGSAFMGVMSAGTMTAFSVSDGAMGPQIATAPLDASGTFSMSLGVYSGPVMLQASGGTFHDLATGTTMTMQAGDVMTGVIPSFPAGATMTGLHVTPLTSMAQARAQMMSGGMTAANIASANASVGSYFMVNDILMDTPMDVAQSGSRAGAMQTQMNHGMIVAAMSQYAQSIGMTSSSGMVTAMMKDASDGVLNGMMGSTSIDMTGMSGGGMGGMGGGTMMPGTAGTSGMANAMSTFIGSGMNMSGVTASDMQALMTKLGASNGMMP